jgi:aminopeptidase N
LATFLEYLVTQETTGKPEVDAEANSLLDWLRGALPTHEAWSRVPLVDYGRAGMTDLSYSVAAVYFDLLYRLAGRETFNRIIGGYYAAFHTRGGGVRDFAEVLRKTATMDLSQLNNDWLFTPAWADRVEHSATIEDLEAYYRRGAPGER